MFGPIEIHLTSLASTFLMRSTSADEQKNPSRKRPRREGVCYRTAQEDKVEVEPVTDVDAVQPAKGELVVDIPEGSSKVCHGKDNVSVLKKQSSYPSLLREVCETKYMYLCRLRFMSARLDKTQLRAIHEQDRFDEYYDLYCMLVRLELKLDFQFGLCDSIVHERYCLLMNIMNLINHCYNYGYCQYFCMDSYRDFGVPDIVDLDDDDEVERVNNEVEDINYEYANMGRECRADLKEQRRILRSFDPPKPARDSGLFPVTSAVFLEYYRSFVDLWNTRKVGCVVQQHTTCFTYHFVLRFVVQVLMCDVLEVQDLVRSELRAGVVRADGSYIDRKVEESECPVDTFPQSSPYLLSNVLCGSVKSTITTYISTFHGYSDHGVWRLNYLTIPVDRIVEAVDCEDSDDTGGEVEDVVEERVVKLPVPVVYKTVDSGVSPAVTPNNT